MLVICVVLGRKNRNDISDSFGVPSLRVGRDWCSFHGETTEEKFVSKLGISHVIKMTLLITSLLSSATSYFLIHTNKLRIQPSSPLSLLLRKLIESTVFLNKIKGSSYKTATTTTLAVPCWYCFRGNFVLLFAWSEHQIYITCDTLTVKYISVKLF